MNKTQLRKLIQSLKRRLDFHRTNQNDPHGVGNAVIVALSEIINALEDIDHREPPAWK